MGWATEAHFAALACQTYLPPLHLFAPGARRPAARHATLLPKPLALSRGASGAYTLALLASFIAVAW